MVHLSDTTKREVREAALGAATCAFLIVLIILLISLLEG